MLTLLSTVKARLAIYEFELKYDPLLTNAIKAVSTRFDKETNRTLSRTVNALQEFGADETEIRVGALLNLTQSPPRIFSRQAASVN